MSRTKSPENGFQVKIRLSYPFRELKFSELSAAKESRVESFSYYVLYFCCSRPICFLALCSSCSAAPSLLPLLFCFSASFAFLLHRFCFCCCWCFAPARVLRLCCSIVLLMVTCCWCSAPAFLLLLPCSCSCSCSDACAPSALLFHVL